MSMSGAIGRDIDFHTPDILFHANGTPARPNYPPSPYICLTCSQDVGPTGTSTTNIISNPAAELTILQSMSYISCSNAVGTLNPWIYLGGPDSIHSGQPITFTLTSYATTMQTMVFTQVYPTVSMETVPASVVVWNVRGP